MNGFCFRQLAPLCVLLTLALPACRIDTPPPAEPLLAGAWQLKGLALSPGPAGFRRQQAVQAPEAWTFRPDGTGWFTREGERGPGRRNAFRWTLEKRAGSDFLRINSRTYRILQVDRHTLRFSRTYLHDGGALIVLYTFAR